LSFHTSEVLCTSVKRISQPKQLNIHTKKNTAAHMQIDPFYLTSLLPDVSTSIDKISFDRKAPNDLRN
jgi:hypothetical protein